MMPPAMPPLTCRMANLKYVTKITPTGPQLRDILAELSKRVSDTVDPELLENDEYKLIEAIHSLRARLAGTSDALRNLALKMAKVSTSSPHDVLRDARAVFNRDLLPLLSVAVLAHTLWDDLLMPFANLLLSRKVILDAASIDIFHTVLVALKPVLLARLSALNPSDIVKLFQGSSALDRMPSSLQALHAGIQALDSQAGVLAPLQPTITA